MLIALIAEILLILGGEKDKNSKILFLSLEGKDKIKWSGDLYRLTILKAICQNQSHFFEFLIILLFFLKYELEGYQCR